MNTQQHKHRLDQHVVTLPLYSGASGVPVPRLMLPVFILLGGNMDGLHEFRALLA